MSSTRRLKRSITRSAARGVTVLGVAGGLAGLTLASPFGAAAAAADGSPQVIDQETVQAKLDPAGNLESARIYSQLTVLGKGTVKVQDPTSRKGLRDLDGFSSPFVQDGKAQYSITVDGREERRTVADFDGQLPVTLKAAYKLDGKEVEAEDVVGRSGTLEVTYTVVNRTAEDTEITYKNGKGVEVTETVGLVTPYVGSLGLTLPAQFKNVQAPGADGGGDGHGGTALSWTLVLFDPIGAPAQRLSWTAEVQDAELPPTTLQVVPVDTGGNQVLETSQTTIGEGAAAAAALTAGAYKIDGKVLEVRDGARKILDGLVKLSDGARKLETGLVDSAAPGARKLAEGAGKIADGTGQVKDGTGQLAPGAKQLADGSRQLASGAGELATGSGALATGSGALASGASDLSDGIGLILAGVESLPQTVAADPGFLALKDALAKVQAGIGTPTDLSTATLLGGLNLTKLGFRSPLGPDGCDQTAAPGTPTACAIADGLEIISKKQAAAVAPGAAFDQLIAAAKAAYVGSTLPDGVTPCPQNPSVPVPPVVPPTLLPDGTVCDYISNVVYGLGLPAGVVSASDPGGVKAQTALTSQKLAAMYGAIDQQVLPGLAKMALGLSNPAWDVNGNGRVDDGEKPGIKEVQGLVSGGLDLLVAGISQTLAGYLGDAYDGSVLVAGGAVQVADGTAKVADGAGKVADGSSKVADGAGKLSDGAAKLDEGVGKLDAGAGELAAGADKLADGLVDAGDGSTKIADGVDAVKDGVDKLQDGANRLSGEGTSLLAGSANNAATANAKKTAMLAAMAEKGAQGALPYGAPEGAVGDAAFSYVLAGANSDAEDSTTRGVVALAVLGLGSLSAFVVRRRLT